MGGGSNGQAQESSNLIAQQGISSDRYDAATGAFTSPKYLAALQPNGEGNNTAAVSRVFTSGLTNAPEQDESSSDALTAEQTRGQREAQIRRDSKAAEETRTANTAAFKRAGAISSSFGENEK